MNIILKTIVKYVRFLNDLGLVEETTKSSTTAGRKSVYIAINNGMGVNIALVFYVTHIRGVLVDLGGVILDEFIEPSYKKIFGIGLAMGGYLNPSTGVSHDFLYAKDWYDVPLKEIIEARYQVPCFLMNNANAFAMGDKYYGYDLGYDHFLSIKMDEGIDIGIIANGSLYLGGNSYAGEFGHTILEGNTKACYCGHTKISRLRGLSDNELTIEQIITAANNGDRFAQNLFKTVEAISLVRSRSSHPRHTRSSWYPKSG